MENPLSITLGARMSAYLVTPEDYRKQRQRLNKRLNKLRHELNIITKDTKNYKTKEKITKINQEDYESNDKYGLLLLLTAERDVLYALEIKTQLEITSEKVSSYKNLMISKIKRALLTCKKLLDITSKDSNDIKKLELYVYTSLIQGLLSVTKKQWSLALNSFSIAKCSLEFLLSKKYNNDDNEEFEDDEEENVEQYKTLIHELLESLVDPSLNLSINQSDNIQPTSDLKTISRIHCHDKSLPYLTNAIKIIETIDPSFVAQLSSSVELIKTIQWRHHEATIYNDEIAFKIMKLTTSNQWENFDEVNEFDSLITGWSEVLDLHTNDQSKNQDDDDLEKVQDRAILLTYINYNLLFTRLKRDLVLVDQLTNSVNANNKDTYRLYTGIITICQELQELPGVYNDDELYESLQNLEKFFQGKKNVVLATTYQQINKFIEALQIYEYTDKSISSAIGKKQPYTIEEFPYKVTSNEEFLTFKQDLNKKLLHCHISAQFLHDSSNQNVQQFVVENVNKYPTTSLSNIINTGKILPILSKPVLFDVGYNYISYPSTGTSSIAAAVGNASSKISSAIGDNDEQEASKRGGFFGIFGRG
ncbi:signal recognition particle, subunit SRP68 [Scheffersomyces coipomensis]|uniref:signal recognition particle, subunit SRP68 n=1 Tax=Scheffersomyces coipomensis TaxID=1788519 RepID=UPI00315D5D1E